MSLVSAVARGPLMKLLVNSAALLYTVATLNLSSCGIAWSDDTRSDSSLYSHRSEYNVSRRVILIFYYIFD